jgi:hypothetical protein
VVEAATATVVLDGDPQRRAMRARAAGRPGSATNGG